MAGEKNLEIMLTYLLLRNINTYAIMKALDLEGNKKSSNKKNGLQAEANVIFIQGL